MKLTGALDGILPGHGIGYVQSVGRLNGGRDGVEFAHEIVVDVQTSGGVDQHDVEPQFLRLHDRGPRSLDRVALIGRIVNPQTCLFAQHTQLLDGRWTSHVRRYQQRVTPLTHQPSPELGRRRGLPRTLESQHQDHLRSTSGICQPTRHLAKERQ